MFKGDIRADQAQELKECPGFAQTVVEDLGDKDNPAELDGMNEDRHVTVRCHWCDGIIVPDEHNQVHVGGIGEVFACDTYLKGEDCRKVLAK